MPALQLGAAVGGLSLIFLVLWDTFETIIVPRTLMRVLQFRLTRVYYRLAWTAWKHLAQLLLPAGRREVYFGAFGPLSLLLLIALWAAMLVLGFALVHWGVGGGLRTPDGRTTFGSYLYLSGTTFFTLGIGDVTPRSNVGRVVTIIEAGGGMMFLAAVISYLPVLYQAFGQRERGVAAIYRRVGIPPRALILLQQYAAYGQLPALAALLQSWEEWIGNLQESHLSYPMLALYRSHRAEQSWLAALGVVLDSCALLQLDFQDGELAQELRLQSKLTFEAGCQVLADLVLLLHVDCNSLPTPCLPPEEWHRICGELAAIGLAPAKVETAADDLRPLRERYEAQLMGLARHLCVVVPRWARTREHSAEV